MSTSGVRLGESGFNPDNFEIRDSVEKERISEYKLEVALQKDCSGALGAFENHSSRVFRTDEDALQSFEREEIGYLLLGNWNSELGQYIGNFRVAFRVFLGEELIGEGDKNQFQYAAECIPE